MFVTTIIISDLDKPILQYLIKFNPYYYYYFYLFFGTCQKSAEAKGLLRLLLKMSTVGWLGVGV